MALFFKPFTRAMLLDDQNLLKILQYGKINEKDIFEHICRSLGLEFYFEGNPSVYTISSEFFVLDISQSNCNLLFVDESLNVKLAYVQDYFNQFIENKFIFYHLLKYLNSCNNPIPSNNFNQDCSTYKCICNCIFKSKYCHLYDLSKIPATFNIFTHSELDYPLDLFFNKNIDQKFDLPENLAEIYTPEKFNKNVYKYFNKEQDSHFIYKFDNVKVIDRSVYVSEERSRIASLAFVKGCSLEESLDFANIFKK
jgi:hypothetical protein